MITSWLGFGKKTLKKKPEGRKIQKPFSHILDFGQSGSLRQTGEQLVDDIG